MTRNIYPTYYELCKSAPLLARKVLLKAYEETRNISEVARLFQTTRKTVRKVLRRWKERGEDGLKDLSRRPRSSPRRTSAAVEGLMFMLLVIYFVRSFGIEHKITLQTDNGEEFGGKSVDK